LTYQLTCSSTMTRARAVTLRE